MQWCCARWRRTRRRSTTRGRTMATVPFPDWIEPMAATLTQERFSGPEWIFERKFDGIRLLAFRKGSDVRLFSRNQLPQNCPPVAEAIMKLAVRDVILDGELTWGRTGIVYHVFDVVWLNGRDLTTETLEQRKAALDTIALKPPLQRVALLSDATPWETACNEGWEGVIAKRRDSRYEHR